MTTSSGGGQARRSRRWGVVTLSSATQDQSGLTPVGVAAWSTIHTCLETPIPGPSEKRRRFILAGALCLNLGFAMSAYFLAFQYAPLRALARSTGNWISPTRVVNAIGLLLVICGWLVAVGRTSPGSLGLDRSTLLRGLSITAGAWIGVQALAAAGALASGRSLIETSPNLRGALPILFGQLAGNAAYEEIFYRGYLIRALTPDLGGRSWAAVLLSSALFGLMHIANYWVRGLAMSLLVPATLAGVLLGFTYVRTRNLWLCIGLHSLLNAPVPIWESPVPTEVAPAVVLLLCLGLGPRPRSGTPTSL